MSFLQFLFGRRKKSASVAKQRLQLVLAAERSPRSARRPDYLPALQRELLGVLSKYVKVQAKDIRISFERQRDIEVIRVKIELPQALRA
jgi:cell division topological specificity factor